jgi:hypothetical protein
MDESTKREILKLFEAEGKLFARYWLSSKIAPVIDAQMFERFIEPYFTLLIQGWEENNPDSYPESDEEIARFLQEAAEALKRGWQNEMDSAKEARRVWNILNKK